MQVEILSQLVVPRSGCVWVSSSGYTFLTVPFIHASFPSSSSESTYTLKALRECLKPGVVSRGRTREGGCHVLM